MSGQAHNPEEAIELGEKETPKVNWIADKNGQTDAEKLKILNDDFKNKNYMEK